jgi:very-short-patch-repair endonuclease
MKTASYWNNIRNFYKSVNPQIMAEKANIYAVDPYGVDVEMTPIERMMWSDIRSLGAVFYPQYPLSGVFVDFANPVAKVAIECDGKSFHNPIKDKFRDEKLVGLGWTIYRISGSDCVKDGVFIDDDKYELSPGEVLIKHIKKTHGV